MICLCLTFIEFNASLIYKPLNQHIYDKVSLAQMPQINNLVIRVQTNKIWLLAKKCSSEAAPKDSESEKTRIVTKVREITFKDFPAATFWPLQPHLCSFSHIMAPAVTYLLL